MLRLAAVFGAHMVLQREKPLAVFGWADGPVRVTLGGERAEAACEGGRFLAHLPPMKAGGPYEMAVCCGEERVTLGDVWIGEVWLCGGQSNMEFRLRDERHFAAMNRVEDRRVRLYEVPQAATEREAERLERASAWKCLSPGGCADVSAVACYAAEEMARRLDVAVGMVVCCIGGTSASCWMSREDLAGFPEGRAYLEDFEARVRGKSDEQFERECAAYQREVDAFNAAVDALKRENPHIAWAQISERAGQYPWPPPDGRTMLRRPGGPYATMLERVAPYTLRGFLYYQGEQDAPVRWAKAYRALFGTLMRRWRALFADETLWFVAAQLPRYGADAAVEDWAAIRAAQQAAVDGDARAALACLIDCGEADNVHPTDKRTPGRRLAALALSCAYGVGEGEAPRAVSASQRGDLLTVAIRGEGIELRGLPALEIEGATALECRAREDALLVRLKGRARRIRYAQGNFPEIAVFDRKGLPLFPFDLRVDG